MSFGLLHAVSGAPRLLLFCLHSTLAVRSDIHTYPDRAFQIDTFEK